MNNTDLNKFSKFLLTANNLKDTTRWESYKAMTKKESSADHSWRVALMAIIFINEYNLKLNVAKALKMATLHDLVEAIAGDVDHLKVKTGQVTKAQKEKAELKAIETLKKTLPKKSGEEIHDTWLEYEKAESTEAKFIKAVDKLETFDHMTNYAEKVYRPDIVPFYANEALRNFPQLIPFLSKLKKKLKAKYKKLGIPWKKEYEEI